LGIAIVVFVSSAEAQFIAMNKLNRVI